MSRVRRKVKSDWDAWNARPLGEEPIVRLIPSRESVVGVHSFGANPVVLTVPNPDSCLQLVRVLAVEVHENWLEENRALTLADLAELKKLQLREAA